MRRLRLLRAPVAGARAVLRSSRSARFGRGRRRRGIFDSFFGPCQRPRVRREPSRATATRRRRAAQNRRSRPAPSVVVMGDSMADWLAYGLEDALARHARDRDRAQESDHRA